MEVSVARRGFLKGRIRPAGNVLLPPWSAGDDRFHVLCDRCGDCIRACPTTVLKTGDGGYPEVDFQRAECSFCADCVTACGTGALQRSEEGAPWGLRARIGDACLAVRGIECRVCGECCPEVAIRFRPRLGGAPLPELDGERCNGCGACFGPCPVRAIAMEKQQ